VSAVGVAGNMRALGAVDCGMEASDMSRGELDELIQRWTTEAVGEGRTAVFDDLLSEDVRDISGATESRGRESFIARARAVLRGDR
jgi:hypothetical protein